jgi:hypothetical protein
MTFLVFLVSFSLVDSTDKVVLAIFLLPFLIYGQTNWGVCSKFYLLYFLLHSSWF